MNKLLVIVLFSFSSITSYAFGIAGYETGITLEQFQAITPKGFSGLGLDGQEPVGKPVCNPFVADSSKVVCEIVDSTSDSRFPAPLHIELSADYFITPNFSFAKDSNGVFRLHRIEAVIGGPKTFALVVKGLKQKYGNVVSVRDGAIKTNRLGVRVQSKYVTADSARSAIYVDLNDETIDRGVLIIYDKVLEAQLKNENKNKYAGKL
jgi:hypothetical protein